jgi:putative hydrolase of the HAD superfamily
MIKTIGFDADDTLWQNETFYFDAQEKMKTILSEYVEGRHVDQAMLTTEKKNLGVYGYGAKSFTLSMIEAAQDLSEGKIKASQIGEIIQIGKELITADVLLLEHTKEIVHRLADLYTLMVITKGDLLDQESKLRRSNLLDFFDFVEIVSEKTDTIYQGLLEKYAINTHEFLMIGNSLRSDVLPVVAIGAQAIHIPFHTTWELEIPTSDEIKNSAYHSLEHLGQLPTFLENYQSP